ncbi:ABC transporter permease subunit [Paenibacillus sp. D2_2]|uniref:carbohydrate ABC transporter permease n=1 Tax=Paenibacillus sp. D2_2 TaxID=3073092 RepID=UPI002814FD7C|nr:ABC transporter permease subunit [Paenibacillus sp. D2_2]WMT40881.1 ABC transporter permease subunit [Paenibacillus sp. D2_2]
MLESVQIDGGGTFTIFRRIMLPLTRPALASMAILTFIGSWNNFLWPFLSVTDDNLFTLPMGIPTLMDQFTEDYVKPMVINTVASLPIVVVFLVFERQIIKGISLSGIKG